MLDEATIAELAQRLQRAEDDKQFIRMFSIAHPQMTAHLASIPIVKKRAARNVRPRKTIGCSVRCADPAGSRSPTTAMPMRIADGTNTSQKISRFCCATRKKRYTMTKPPTMPMPVTRFV